MQQWHDSNSLMASTARQSRIIMQQHSSLFVTCMLGSLAHDTNMVQH